MSHTPLAIRYATRIACPWTRACYEAGRHLVEVHGLHTSHVAWDADEVLWDWVIDAPATLRSLPRMRRDRYLGHTQWIRFRPGMLALLSGLSDATRSVGGDPRVRVWTNGWRSRIHAIGAAEPLFGALLGFDNGERAATQTLFARLDYAHSLPLRLAHLSEDRARGVLARQLGREPTDSTFKVPWITGSETEALGAVRFLVDDTKRTSERFARGGRGAVAVARPPLPPSGVPHLSLGRPARALRAVGKGTATRTIAAALAALCESPNGSVIDAPLEPIRTSSDAVTLRLTFPHEDVWTEWLQPSRSLRREGALPRAARGRVLG